jgi:hypothetical protein
MRDDHVTPDALDMVTPALPRKLKLSALVPLVPGQLYHLSGQVHMSLDAVVRAEQAHGLHDPANLDARVKWVAYLREVVALRCPKNAIGTPVVSDISLLQATARERLIAFILWRSNAEVSQSETKPQNSTQTKR